MPPLPRPGLRVGTDYFTRCGLIADRAAKPAHGIVDDVSELLSATGSPTAPELLPALRRFFAETDSLHLQVHSRWHPLILPLWVLARLVMLLMQQLVYPVRRARVHTRVVALDPARAGTGRGVVRTYADGSAFQIFVYTVTASSTGPITEVFIPLPFSNLRGRLHLDPISATEVLWTSAPSASDPTTGVWFELGRWSLRTPLAESITLFDATCAQCPDRVRAVDPQALLYGRHVQRLWRFALVEHLYAFRLAM